MCQKRKCIQALLCLYQETNSLVDTLPDEEIPIDHINFLNKNMLIEDDKVKVLIYSGNTVVFLLPNSECM